MMAVNPDLQRIVDAIRSRQRFVLSSHARPDGDSIGSQLAMGYALREMGKAFDVVNADPAPGPLMQFPGVPEIRIAPAVEDDFDAAIIMECGDLARTGVSGLDRFPVINIDHHPGNTAYGSLNWFDASAAGGMSEDTEGLINLPLTVKEIQAVVFFKQSEGEEYRVSMRSKGDVDIGAVAKEFNGGGHKNAAGCTVRGGIDALQKMFIE